ncbi:BZ3500_MvSof-1268-A1-R1_Chr6-3g08756 [Microbotryum saponariae]|uniref:Autophagy-related protein 27 n=1 Tax=Microbotryum saponariae TaxID=289078 RepID=A0A2X0NNL5_9BASI|nr:BZ3500_MvSof-1268-A1-R1_Chr6-3g08756 [Microbotryum saponariae]SDA07357.1 BZ3501_MvSof-1269-A2-R1_Chr6-2g08459 [Microbotryum saponariae]
MLPRSILLTCVALLASSRSAHAADEGRRRISEPCRLHDPHTGSYDLRALQRKGEHTYTFDLARSAPQADVSPPCATGRDYNVTNPVSGETYALNFCGPVIKEMWAVRDAEKVGAYTEGPKSGISLGNFETTPVMMNGHLTLTYPGGSFCPNSNAKRTSVIYLQCDSSWSTQEPELISVAEDCFYVFSFKTPHACPTSFAAGIFSSIVVFFLFILTACIVSFGSALTYNRYVLHQRGSSAIPSIEKVRDALDALKDFGIMAGIWLLDQGEKIVSLVRNSRSNSSPWGRRGLTDYTQGAWSRTARDGFSAGGLEGGGSLLADDSDEEDDEDQEQPPRRESRIEVDDKKPLPGKPTEEVEETEQLFKVTDDEE